MIQADEALIRQAGRGDQAAFTALYNRYWKRLYLYAYKIFEDELACEDLVQDVFVRLWERAAEVEIENLEAYLIQSVNNRTANLIRRAKFTSEHEKALAALPSFNPSHLDVEIRELEDQLDQGIALLPDKCREIFVLSRKHHLSNPEIATRLNLSVRTVETHIYRALQALRTHLGEVTMLLMTLLLGI